MSAKTKRSAEYTAEYLKKADINIKYANEYAKETGDKTLIEKVTKIQRQTEETYQEIDKKLNNG